MTCPCGARDVWSCVCDIADPQPHALQISGELARRTMSCCMNDHDACVGTVPGGLRAGVRCLCDCHRR